MTACKINAIHTQFIELVKLQYSGAEPGLLCGIGIFNLVHSAGSQKDFYPIDYGNYAPDQDGKTKNERFFEMVITAVYAKNLKQVHRLLKREYRALANRRTAP